MKEIFTIFILAALSCFATNTNIDYAALPKATANEDMYGMVLSNETNFLKSGVWINDTNHTIIVRNGEVADKRATVAMLNMSTNEIHFWYFWPSTDLQFDIKLVDDKGNEVQKTAYGQRFGHISMRDPDNLDVLGAHGPRTYGLRNWAIMPQGELLEESFDYNPVRSLPRCFKTEKPGNFQFTLIRHIYMSELITNHYVLKPVTFSPVVVNVRVESIKK